MCGICGFYNRTNTDRAAETLSEMAGSLVHRGPDGTGTWLSPDRRTGLANTRLAIIDIAGGSQPIHSSDRHYTIVFNGEIYNFAELRDQLEAAGSVFQTDCDTEIALLAYRQWGIRCLDRFRGMFAVAIYDRMKEELFLARDRTGIKPLYYSSTPRGFYFGSELKAVLKNRDLSRSLDYCALSDFLVLGYPLLPKTFFAGVRELEPGTWMKVSTTGLTQGRYWQWTRQPAPWSESEALEASEKAIITSLREHLVADVPVGAFLSGGIDSSLLTALLVQALGKRPQVFTVAFAESAYDESPFARMVASHLGIPHTQIVLDPRQSDVSMVNDLLLQFDQPFGDSSAIPTNLICREIRKSVKVAIGGDGGDEMFGGYARFWYADVARSLGALPAFCLKASWQMLYPMKTLRPEIYRKSERLVRASQARSGQRLLNLSCYIYPDKIRQVLTPAALEQVSSYQPSLLPDETGQSTNAGGAEFTDSTIRYVLPGDYLRKVDMMSSAHGLEVRVPFLGEAVLTCAAQIPEQLKYSRSHNKLILRKLAAKYLPEAVVNKPKGGFGIPLDSWLGRQGREQIRGMLSAPTARIAPLVQRDYVVKLLSGFAEQNPNLPERSRYNTYQQVYALWALELWLNRWTPAL